ncbi:MAG: hypothetical protein KGD68_04255 [Candidatus Lokiarchaeota archaeon]|nr:hypothetical protein [Candidatus Lokiarchaeota archaeon]
MKPREILLKILASTVLTSVIIVLVVMMLGVGFSNNSSENDYQIPGMGAPIIFDPSVLGNDISEESFLERDLSILKNEEVLVAELTADYSIDTESGFMIVNYDIPDVLPLCITEYYLDSNFAITTMTYGGYVPDGFGYLGINQPKTGKGGLVAIEWVYVGSFVCENPDLVCYGCLVDIFSADFILPDPIQIDSNHIPDVFSYGADWYTMIDDPVSCDLDKWVNLAILSSWKGCDDPDQKFQLILAHLIYFLEFPISV